MRWAPSKEMQAPNAPNIGIANTPLLANISIGYTFK
jgi:hypothetical protein